MPQLSPCPATSLLEPMPRRATAAWRRRPPLRSALRLAITLLLAAPAAAIAQDVTPPALVSYVASPNIVDVTTGPVDITFTSSFTDVGSGFAQADVLYTPPDFSSLYRVTITADDLVSGDPSSGVFETVVAMPQYSRSGLWSIFSFKMEDEDGNVSYASPASLPPTALFDVVSVPDLAPPSLTSFSLTTTSIDVTTAATAVPVEVAASDDVSGVDRISVTLESPSGNETAAIVLDAGHRTGGDELDGVYAGSIVVSHYAEAGAWTTTSVELVDSYGYLSVVPGASLPGGLPTLTVAKSADSGDPQIVWLQIDPHPVDLVAGATSTTVRARLTDAVSGVVNAGVLIQSPTNLDNESASFSAANRISGTSLDGIYEDTVDFAPGDPLGYWPLQVVANDAAGNGILVTGGAIPGPSALALIITYPPPPDVPSMGPLGVGVLVAVLAIGGARRSRQSATGSREPA